MKRICGSTWLNDTCLVLKKYRQFVLNCAFNVAGSNDMMRLSALVSRTTSIVESLFHRFGVPESAVCNDRFMYVLLSVIRTILLPKLGSTTTELALGQLSFFGGSLIGLRSVRAW